MAKNDWNDKILAKKWLKMVENRMKISFNSTLFYIKLVNYENLKIETIYNIKRKRKIKHTCTTSVKKHLLFISHTNTLLVLNPNICSEIYFLKNKLYKLS